MIISSISTKLWILCSNDCKKWTKSPISQFAIFAKLISLKTIELNRVSIFFHEIFRINVELPDDLKLLRFGVEFWVRPLKTTAEVLLDNCRTTDEVLLDNCRTTAEVMPDNFRKTTEVLLDNCRSTAGQLPDNCRSTAGQLPDNYRSTAGQLLDNYRSTAGQVALSSGNDSKVELGWR